MVQIKGLQTPNHLDAGTFVGFRPTDRFRPAVPGTDEDNRMIAALDRQPTLAKLDWRAARDRRAAELAAEMDRPAFMRRGATPNRQESP
jgi:hypothetical protein